MPIWDQHQKRSTLSARIATVLLCCFSNLTGANDQASMAQMSEPTVNGAWIVLFLVVFVAVCAWFVIAIIRAAQRKDSDTREG
jgi:heme/copper-type cytochrome/quinol oxidase subunit 2